MAEMSNNQYTLRMASDGDGAAVRHLADLDSRPSIDGSALIAEIDGVPVAAMSLARGDVVADPFRPTADAVELLEARARSLRDRYSSSGWRRTGLRAAPASSSRRTGVV
jgi:hypothetical protein